MGKLQDFEAFFTADVSSEIHFVQQLLRDLWTWLVEDLFCLGDALFNVGFPCPFCSGDKDNPSFFDRFDGWFAFWRFCPLAPHSNGDP